MKTPCRPDILRRMPATAPNAPAEADASAEVDASADPNAVAGADMLSDEDLRWFAAACKALGHPVRARILTHLAAIDRCVCGAIVDMLPLAQSTVSQHLKQLKAAGLIRGEVAGPRTCYCVDHDALARFKALAHGLYPPARTP